MKNKITQMAIIFLLLVPFRLVIGVMMIKAFNYIAQLGGKLSDDVLVSNIMVTKGIYDMALSYMLVSKIEYLLRDKNGRKAIFDDRDELVYWQTTICSILMFFYVCFDISTTHSLYFSIR